MPCPTGSASSIDLAMVLLPDPDPPAIPRTSGGLRDRGPCDVGAGSVTLADLAHDLGETFGIDVASGKDDDEIFSRTRSRPRCREHRSERSCSAPFEREAQLAIGEAHRRGELVLGDDDRTRKSCVR